MVYKELSAVCPSNQGYNKTNYNCDIIWKTWHRCFASRQLGVLTYKAYIISTFHATFKGAKDIRMNDDAFFSLCLVAYHEFAVKYLADYDTSGYCCICVSDKIPGTFIASLPYCIKSSYNL